jgi:DNA invertase Pin-like site-specific DNA recombinase
VRPILRKTVRCAIYTRVSTENGLDQEFNSLDAQREASAACIKSQAHAGWTEIRTRYDDGGYSGGSTERPALQRLLDDVSAGKIDVIVVYKVDRLTRSLADFAKLVELFDAHGVSFVSVTQQFNTTTSMGRLTLNVLLSFAQFEREVTSERIRDKIAASKRKGIWVGGPLPLGYEMQNGKVTVVAEEAERVRFIFRRYLELGAAHPLLRDLRQRQIFTKRRPPPLGYDMRDGKIAVVEREAEQVRLIFRRYLELSGVNALVRDRTAGPDAAGWLLLWHSFRTAIVRGGTMSSTALRKSRSLTSSRELIPATSARTFPDKLTKAAPTLTAVSTISSPTNPRIDISPVVRTEHSDRSLLTQNSTAASVQRQFPREDDFVSKSVQAVGGSGNPNPAGARLRLGLQNSQWPVAKQTSCQAQPSVGRQGCGHTVDCWGGSLSTSRRR